MSAVRVPVGALPRTRQAQLVLRRALARIEARREHLEATQARRLPGTEPAPGWYRGWPLSLPDPRWVVSRYVDETSRRARSFALDADERRELTDALLVVLALEAAP